MGVGNVSVQTWRHCRCIKSVWVLAMSVYKPADIAIAVSQSLWVLAMCVFKAGDIVITVRQSLWVLAVCVYKPADIAIAVSQSLWVLAMSVYKPGDIVIGIFQSLGVDNACVCTNLATSSLEYFNHWVLTMRVCVQTWRHCHCSKSVTVGVGNVCRSL